MKGFIEILGELHIKDSNGFHKKELKEKYSNLDSKYKSTVEDKKENKFSKISTAFRNQSHNKRGWMSNGIWNDLCMANFEGRVFNPILDILFLNLYIYLMSKFT